MARDEHASTTSAAQLALMPAAATTLMRPAADCEVNESWRFLELKLQAMYGQVEVDLN
jgi:hypothetical protein